MRCPYSWSICLRLVRTDCYVDEVGIISWMADLHPYLWCCVSHNFDASDCSGSFTYPLCLCQVFFVATYTLHFQGPIWDLLSRVGDGYITSFQFQSFVFVLQVTRCLSGSTRIRLTHILCFSIKRIVRILPLCRVFVGLIGGWSSRPREFMWWLYPVYHNQRLTIIPYRWHPILCQTFSCLLKLVSPDEFGLTWCIFEFIRISGIQWW